MTTQLLKSQGLDAPYKDPMVDKEARLTFAWLNFFRSILERISFISQEFYMSLENNQVLATPINNLQFDSTKVNAVHFDYLTQRLHEGSAEQVLPGKFFIYFRPKSLGWDIQGAADSHSSSFTLANNQTTAADVTGIDFSNATFKAGILNYNIQRITTGTGATRLIESGTLYVTKNDANEYVLSQAKTRWPMDAGVTFSVTTAGKLQYKTTNIGGTPSVSTSTFKVRSFDAGLGLSLFVDLVTGQLLYTTSNLSGATQVAKFTTRYKTIAAKIQEPAGGFL